MMRIHRSLKGFQRGTSALFTAVVGTLLVAACGSSDGTTVSGTTDPVSNQFAVVGTSVLHGAVWQLNRPIDIEFNRDVDFATVSSSTIQIIDNQGGPAVGTFTAITSKIVRFQPRCPTDDLNSNGGFRQNRLYRLSVVSENTPGLGGGVTVLSTAGDRLRVGLNVEFTTPESSDPLILFVDVVAGPPRVRVRGLGGEPADSDRGSFVEFGDGTIEYFAFDPLTSIEPVGEISSLVPLNLYSRTEEQFSIVLRFNQPVFASSSNVNSQLISIEYTYDPVPSTAQWINVPTTVRLIDNCTETGASVGVSPSGIIPQGSTMRVVVREGFQDLTGDRVLASQSRVRFVGDVANPGAPNPEDGSDEILEQFIIGGTSALSREDTAIASPLPRAKWGGNGDGGSLQASFDFDGTGGPGGDFDWRIRSGETVFLNTAGDQITGGPNGDPFFTQPVFNGVVDINDLFVEAGAKLIIVGPNPCTILATGRIEILGEVSLDGGNNTGVGTLNTTNQPEEGASGQAGGGTGGVGSFLTSQSTPQGGPGSGAFEVAGLGGGGGETTYSPPGTCQIENRRGAGGGGGQMGPDIYYEFLMGSPTGFFRCQTTVGMDGEAGFTGCPDATGAISQANAAVGGIYAPSPFLDTRDDNNFFGTLLTSGGAQILGELASVWAGSGGGAGGDAVRSATFPLTPFTIQGDEKGSGGGGGAGGLIILAIGNIEILGDGSLTADGGYGGGGENSIFFDRIGGGSGGGSGGHIVLSSASAIIIESEATSASVGDFYLDLSTAPIHEKRPLRALGGQGGAGKDSRCGANQNGTTQWRQDAIPLEYFGGNGTIPPQQQAVWQQCNAIDACAIIEPPEGTVIGGGGDGGPGIIQLHVADPATQLLFPNATGVYGVNLDPTRSMSPPPLGWTAPDQPADVMIPFFSARSEAFSQWIPLGLARLQSGNPPVGVIDQVELLFDGTNPADGNVIRDGTVAQELTPLLPYTALSIGGVAPSVNTSTAEFTIPAAGIDDIYTRNAALTREFAIRIREAGTIGSDVEFLVQSGEYDAANDNLLLVVDPRGPELFDTLLSMLNPQVELVPFYFRLVSASVHDSFPVNTEIVVAFDATVVNTLTGEPSADPADSFSGGDITNFATNINVLNMGTTWDFVRFKVSFNLDSANTGVDLAGARPGLDFLRIPYRF